MSRQKLAVVTSITGTQAQATARAFIERGYRVRGLSRHAGATHVDFEPITVDPTNADAMAKVLDGADVVAFTSPIDYRAGVRERLAETLVAAAESAGVRRLIHNAAAAVLENYDRPVSIDMKRIRDIFLSARVEAIALQPTVYMDNLIEPWAKPSIVNEGIFAYPMHPDARVSWISHKSLGEFIVAAAEMPLTDKRIFDIGGPDALTGGEIAQTLSAIIGRPVSYHFVPPKEFAVGLNKVFGEPVGDHIGDLYLYVEKNLNALARNSDAYSSLGVQPESFAQWANRQNWFV